MNEQSPYDAGYEAYFSKAHNPYEADEDQAEWECGYGDAEDDAEEDQLDEDDFDDWEENA